MTVQCAGFGIVERIRLCHFMVFVSLGGIIVMLTLLVGASGWMVDALDRRERTAVPDATSIPKRLPPRPQGNFRAHSGSPRY